MNSGFKIGSELYGQLFGSLCGDSCRAMRLQAFTRESVTGQQALLFDTRVPGATNARGTYSMHCSLQPATSTRSVSHMD
jgi:hypothetical protein